MSDKNTHTRRSALALLGSGAALAVSETAGFRYTENILRRQGSLSVGGNNADISITDRKGNAPGAGNFGNYDPRASSGKTYLSVGNGLADDATTVAASNTNASVSYDGADSEIGADSTEDITLSHGQSSDQTTDISVSDGDVSQALALDNDISIPVAPSSAVSRWTLNSGDPDTANGEATDVWGSDNLTIDSGVTTGAAGPSQTYNCGDAYDFDPGEKLSISSPSVPTGSSPRTVAFWVNLDLFNDGATTVGYGKDGKQNGSFDLRVYNSGKIQFVGWGNDDGGISVSTGQWYHVTCTYDGSTGISLYRNGPESDNNPTATGAVNQLDTVNDVLKVGGSVDESLDKLDGQISDVRIYDKELTATEVDNLYHTGSISP